MNKFKIFSALSLGVLMGMSMTSCEDTLADNVSIDKAHTNTADQGLPVVVFYAQQTVYDHAEYNVFLSQCLTTTGKSQTGSYPYKQGWEFLNINRHPQWRRHFYDIGVNAKELIENSQLIKSPNYELIGRTIRLMSTQLTTDAFGDMPLTEVYLSNTPHYDSQAFIYQWMFDEIEALEAMYEDPAVINAETNRVIDAIQDRVYAGNLDGWKGLLYAVKARLLLRNIPNIDRSPAMCKQIIDAADKAINIWRSGDLRYGAWFGNEPRYNFDGGTQTQNCPWGEAQPKINSWESRDNRLHEAVPSKFFVQDCMGVINPGIEDKQGMMAAATSSGNGNGYGADPRLMLLMVPQNGPISASNANTKIMLRYLENNIGSGSTFKQAHYPNMFAGAYAKNDGYNPIFTMEELYFIKAEAYYWMGDKATACALAKEASQMNIQRHLDRFLADNNGVYPGVGVALTGEENASTVARNEERFNAMILAFLDNVGSGSKRTETKPVTEIGQKHWFFDASNYTLYDLMTQKYISMYMQPEQWTDMRRYHYSNNRNKYGVGESNEIVYPTLRRPYNLYDAYWVNGLTDEQKENTWIQRLNYDPQTEDIYNMKEVVRVGAYKNPEWLKKPMNWALDYGVRSSLTAE
ncbi:MAG: SusD/RagB family nutrient-binding outer membrane lipoprotein [Muribaculaceae bacterium]|nr:SusD/RagB family nutrient-binding outer membrane lipoprotein [Muribaculaceae bacterium]